MTLLLLLFAAGIITSAYLPVLPSLVYLAVSTPFVLILPSLFVKKLPLLALPLGFCIGVFYGILAGHYHIANQLASDLVGQELIVEGQVIDLPESDKRRQLFSFDVEKAYSANSAAENYVHFPAKINVSSYGPLRVKTGENWRLRVKLKRPRGFVNPGGYDYQVSLLRRGVGAVGYVVANSENELLREQPSSSIDVLRYDLQQWLLQKNNSPEKGILVALLVGDTSGVDKQHWGEMLKTGTNHLIAISGLHLGFFAIVGFFLGNVIGRFLQLFWRTCPSMYVGYGVAIFFTVFYSIIAGLNIPTLRTLIMLAVVQWVLIWRRSFRGRDTLLVALVLVLLYDPLASFDIGFWLSFGAVAMLMFCFSGRLSRQVISSPLTAARNHLSVFIKSQWVMFVGLLIPLALLIHSTTLLAPLANFIAIPLVTFFVVPFLILAAIFYCTPGRVANVLEDFFLQGAEHGLAWLHWWLDYLVRVSDDKLTPLVAINPWALVIAVLGVALLLLPRGLGNRWLGAAALCVGLLTPLAPAPALQMLVFDVGQGTAVLLRTPHHQLLYDTGPRYTENFDAGSALVAPYLQSRGINHLDAIVISHNDSDHSGGLAGVLAAISTDALLLGEPTKYEPAPQLFPVSQPVNKNCHEAKPWRWDGVSFRFITWPVLTSAKANNHSCVLLVEYQGHSILLAGDIEKDVERSLLSQQSLQQVDIVLAPHHGSRSSSTRAFVEQLAPGIVIYSAGYRSQHGHPHKDVKARYAAVNSQPFNTAFSGALEFNWNNGEMDPVKQYRQIERRYWFDGEQQ